MARKSNDPDSTPTPPSDEPQGQPPQLDPAVLAEMTRLRDENAQYRETLTRRPEELERLRAENAALAASLAARPEPQSGSGEAPQGITLRRMESGDERKDFHPRWRQIRMIDPKSLVVDGKPPALAIPIDGDTTKVRVRRIEAGEAAYRLTCDPASGGQSVYRLASDEEVAAYEADLEARRAPAERSRQKDLDAPRGK
jgi:hypothetical protein